ncbi:MAG: putative flavoprotein [Isosphaeraceae bacterium]|jgi:phosphopantothenate-cysteine ligase|nr:MAG: putative flavoprotein [Isosphaeraceae bacterium]
MANQLIERAGASASGATPGLLRVLITGGGTIAPIDDVRVIANRSTGALSAELTVAFLRRGAEVWHVRTPTAAQPWERASWFDLDTTDPAAECQRLEAVRREWLTVRDRLHPVRLADGTVSEYAETVRSLLTDQPIDIAILAAAVSDFRPSPFAGKIDSRSEPLSLTLHREPKVIASVKSWAPRVFLVGFKLLSGAREAELIEAGVRLCRETGADLVVANDQRDRQTAPHAAEAHTLWVVDAGSSSLKLMPGTGQLARLAQVIEERYRARES